jgi:ubiquinone/menaquinone biosynthesis C-methylase UbiE
LVPSEMLVHGTGWHELVGPSFRNSAGAIFPAWPHRGRRKEHVISQYETVRSTHEYKLAYAGQRVDSRLLRERAAHVLDLLESSPGGNLLDAGCGPGILVHALLQSERHDFDVTVLDQSPAMIRQCVDGAEGTERLHAFVGDLEALPFGDASFDVTLVTGALEYTDARASVQELSRVTRPGGTVIASMLNPLSPYHLVQWLLFWPALRLLGVIERALGLRVGHRHGAPISGIRAVRRRALLGMMGQAGLTAPRVVFLTPTVLIPPLDRMPSVTHLAEKVTNAIITWGLMPWLATAYLVVASRGLVLSTSAADRPPPP